MNVIEFKSQGKDIVFCFIDNTYQYKSAWARELVKNLADYSISNIFSKGFDIYQSQSEDLALKTVSEKGYKHAVVFSTGTEFINGRSFFNEIEKLTKTEYAVYGHILDRKEAYYELHHQCYLLNLDVYRSLEYPAVGKQQLGIAHTQQEPMRSIENMHDDYTPTHVVCGVVDKEYSHKMHGWNIISKLLDHGHTIYAFNDSIRNNKKHYYPENNVEFQKHISWAYSRYSYCATEFVHTSNTENVSVNETYSQIITPASGTWFVDYLDTPAKVILYDYNQQSLDYWKDHAPAIPNVTYEFLKIDLLGQYDIAPLLKDKDLKTLLNLSNIFCYEGTAMFSSLEYRLAKQQEITNLVPKEWTILVSESSTLGFTDKSKDVKISELKKPTWHTGYDWND